jgi:hypothetical protein
VEKESSVDDIHRPLQHFQSALLALIENVGRDEGSAQCILVKEEIVANVHKVGLEVGAVRVFGGRTIVNELAQVLGDTAAEVEEGGARLHAREDGGVRGSVWEGEIEEGEEG